MVKFWARISIFSIYNETNVKFGCFLFVVIIMLQKKSLGAFSEKMHTTMIWDYGPKKKNHLLYLDFLLFLGNIIVGI